MSSKVLAILCADIHLSHKPPIGRSAEPDWYSAMARQLKQLRKLQREYDCPVICAGDLFDKWNSPAELINFAMQELPQPFYAVPGQHDLPNHRWDDIHRSAYWTLIKSGCVQSLGLTSMDIGPKLTVYGYGWDVDVTPIEGCDRDNEMIHLAVVHAYCYRGPSTKYPDAPSSARWMNWKKKLGEYDAIVFGDNHQPFYDGETNILNCGTFMRRKVDDPLDTYVGVLLDTGKIERIALDNSEDQWIHHEGHVRDLERDWGIREFIDDLTQLRGSKFDFASRVTEFIRDNEVDEGTKQMILECLEDVN